VLNEECSIVGVDGSFTGGVKREAVQHPKFNLRQLSQLHKP
jgi:hypothetical protein